MCGVIEFEIDNKVQRLCKMRNPVSDGEWNGEWSDSYKLWNEELRLEIGAEDKKDGTFHIPYKDFLIFFKET